jgi:multidrug resistance efflux pump
MDNLPVIPTPPGQRWREFRIRFMPLIVFTLTIGGIFFIWSKNLVPPTMVAQVESVITPVTSTDAGIITNVFVQRFQPVQKGDVIAAIVSSDNRQVDSELQLLRSQISLAQLELGTFVDQDRLAFDFHNYRLEYLRQQLDLSVAQAELPHAEFDLELGKKLLQEKIIPELDYRRLESRVDVLHTQISHLSTTTLDLEKRLKQTQDLGDFATTATNTLAIRETLERLSNQRKKLETVQKQLVLLRAPINGVVSSIQHRAGEAVLAGEIIATITATEGERIVGYLRQPFSFTPESGMTVQISSRSWKREQAESQIAAVGAQFEVITNVALMRANLPLEVGLPVAIGIPASLKELLRPGELVDITIHRK